MRNRVRGKRSYYFYDADGPPRKEVALGSEYIAALRKYADRHQIEAPERQVRFSAAITKYRAEVLPLLASSTIRVQQSNLKHVEAYSKEAPMVEVKPMHIARYTRTSRPPRTAVSGFSARFGTRPEAGASRTCPPLCGVETHTLAKRTVYITDQVYQAVHDAASAPPQDAVDLAYLTGQRPGDTLSMSEHDILEGHLIVTQYKTKQPLRIQISGKLAEWIERIRQRKQAHNISTAALLVNQKGSG